MTSIADSTLTRESLTSLFTRGLVLGRSDGRTGIALNGLCQNLSGQLTMRTGFDHSGHRRSPQLTSDRI